MRLDNLLEKLFGPPEPGRGGWAESALEGTDDPNKRSFPLQPRNTVSNAGYALAGLGCFLLGAPVLGFALLLLFLGSSLYHGWPSKGTNRIDHAGMQSTFAALLCYALVLPEWKVAAFALAAAAWGAWKRPDAVTALLAVILATLFVQYDPGLPPLGVLSLAFGMFSMAAWILDRNRSPWLGAWGHAGFHLGTAAAILTMAMAVL